MKRREEKRREEKRREDGFDRLEDRGREVRGSRYEKMRAYVTHVNCEYV